MKAKYLVGLSCCSAVVALTTYIALDTFVLAQAISVVETDPTDAFAQARAQYAASHEEELADAEEPVTEDTEGENATGTDITEAEISAEAEEAEAEERVTAEAAGMNEEENAEEGPGNGDTEEAAAEPDFGDLEVELCEVEYEPYEDEEIRIELTQYRVEDTQVYVAEVSLASVEHLRTAFAQNTFGRNITAKTSVQAEENEAILAINGDNYGSREQGYVIRNGQVYRSDAPNHAEISCIYADGSMGVLNADVITTDDLIGSGAWQVFCFGPTLVEYGIVSVGERDEVDLAMASNPRTAMGLTTEGNYLFVVSDGRTEASAGLTLKELADFMVGLGARQAYNLDGGGSSTMIYLGEVINQPTSGSGWIAERAVNDIVYIR